MILEHYEPLLAMNIPLYNISLFFPHRKATIARTVLDLFFQKLSQNESTTLLRSSLVPKMSLIGGSIGNKKNRAIENTSVDGLYTWIEGGYRNW